MIGRILVGLLFAALGVLILKYTYPLKNAFGSWGWAERYLGNGGTYSAWKLIGIGLMILGVLWATGTLGGLLAGTLGQFFAGSI